MKNRALRLVVVVAGLATLLIAGTGGTAGASPQMTRYVVVLNGTATEDGFAVAGTQQAVTALVGTAGGTVTRDLSEQIGVLVVESPNALFDETLRASPLVDAAAEDFKWKAFPSTQEALASGYITQASPSSVPGGGPAPHADALEPLQWSMRQIRAIGRASCRERVLDHV